MATEENIFIDVIEVVKNGCVEVRTKTAVMENGEQINYTLHRHVVVPGADYTNEDAQVKIVCAAAHTPEVIAAYQAAQIPA
jgi:hypothetical protein